MIFDQTTFTKFHPVYCLFTTLSPPDTAAFTINLPKSIFGITKLLPLHTSISSEKCIHYMYLTKICNSHISTCGTCEFVSRTKCATFLAEFFMVFYLFKFYINTSIIHYLDKYFLSFEKRYIQNLLHVKYVYVLTHAGIICILKKKKNQK